MEILAKIVIVSVAIMHIGFMYMEMVLWKTAKGQKIFKIDAEFALRSATLAANQGLYNGFLASGLIWSLIASGSEAYHLKIFFLTCVLIAGIYGAATASKNILFLQAAPALLALILVYLS